MYLGWKVEKFRFFFLCGGHTYKLVDFSWINNIGLKSKFLVLEVYKIWGIQITSLILWIQKFVIILYLSVITSLALSFLRGEKTHFSNVKYDDKSLRNIKEERMMSVCAQIQSIFVPSGLFQTFPRFPFKRESKTMYSLQYYFDVGLCLVLKLFL